MSESLVAGLKGQLREIEGRLDAAQDHGAREEVKREIIALFKRVDGALTELGQLKDGIRGLAERYKQMNHAAGTAPAGPAPAPQFTGARPAVQADHLGASTFIEKGWSLISLGDHAGAIQALEKALAPGARRGPGAVAAGLGADAARGLRRRADDLLEGPDEGAGQRARPDQRGVHLPQEADLRGGHRASLQGHPAGQRPQGDPVRTLLSWIGVPGARDVRGRPELLRQDAHARTESDRGLLRHGPGSVVLGRQGRRAPELGPGPQGQQVQPLGQTVPGDARPGRRRR